MTTSPSLQIVSSQQLTNAAATLYTSPVATWTRIEKVTLYNSDSASHTYSIYLVPAGSTAGVTNLLVSAQRIAAGASLSDFNIPGNYLNPGDFIAAFADTGAKVVITIGGTQFS
jgi:hypothetical protein